jgi:Holliday junction DNA helicase RuvA
LIAYLDGKITYKSPTHIFVDVGGIAYDVQISLNTYGVIESLDTTKLFTQLIVRDDAHTLFGFHTIEEKELFNKLISVSGIGPNTARVILSYMTPKETVSAILTDNVAAFKKVKGVGPKTAQRIILDLKDKVAKNASDMPDLESLTSPSIRDEAIAALLALGFQKNQVNKAVDKALSQDSGIDQVETLIKSTLRQLS